MLEGIMVTKIEVINNSWLSIQKDEANHIILKLSEIEDILININDEKDVQLITLIMSGGHQHQIKLEVPNELKYILTENQQKEFINNQKNELLNKIINN